MWLREFRRQHTQVADLLFWDALIAPSVAQLKDGYLMACLSLRGPDLDSAVDAELVTQASKLNNILKRLGKGWALLTEVRRREAATYPAATWPDSASARIDAERRAAFTQRATHYVNDTYLTLVYYARAQERSGGWTSFLYEHIPPPVAAETETMAYFTEECQRLVGLLQGCCPEVVLLEDEALLGYLHSTMSTKQHRVRVPGVGERLASYLADMDVSAGLAPRLGEAYIRCISPRGTVGSPAYPEEVYPGILDPLMQLPLEFRATLRYLPLERPAAVAQIRKAGKRWHGKGSSKQETGKDVAALDNWQGAQDAQASVQHGRVGYGHLTATVVVWDTDLNALDRKTLAVEQALNDAGFLAKVETLNAMSAWMGTIPGNLWANPRRALVSSDNLARLFPATTAYQGPRWNTHLNGAPLLQVTGKGGTAFHLSLHADDVGHTLIVGPTGAGKSTLLALLAVQFLRYPGACVYAFDKGQSLRAATYGVGGDWFDVAEEMTAVVASAAGLDDGETHPWESAWIPPPGRWQCFEMEELLHTPAVVPGVLNVLFRELEERLTGAPTLLILDEAWVYLDHPLFAARIREWLKTMRKKNTSVIFSTQSLADAAQSSIAAAVNESCMTRIFLANARALEPQIGALYEAYGLNERQRELIATATPKRHYYYQGMEGNQVFELGLGPVQLAFTGASRPQDLARIRDVYAKDPQGFAEAWLQERGVE